MIQIADVLFAGFGLLCFLLMIIGTKLNWKILVDPDDSWSWYSQTVLKRLFGEEFLVGFNYVVGTLGVGITGFIFSTLLKLYIQQ